MIDPQDMTDEELRNARATWEADRAARWACVSALTGAAYMAAFDEYMTAKAEADAVAAEARRRGIRRRRSGTAGATRPAPSPDSRFEVSATTTGVTAMADGAVRFPETALAELRDRLRAAVARIRVERGQVLRGTFAGELPRSSKTDIENRVLLNIGLSERCLRHGFAFEHDRRAPAGWTCGYDYRAVSADDAFALWRPGRRLAGWNGIALDHGLTAAAIWWALRTRRDATTRGPATAVPATLFKATIESPRPLTLNEIKAVADGVVGAAQWTRTIDPSGVDGLSGNLARAGISADREFVVELLREPTGAGAGHCRGGLIAKDGRVDPDDHLVVAGLVYVKLVPSPSPSVTAALFDALRVGGGR